MAVLRLRLDALVGRHAHWMRDDRDVPADALDRILRIAPTVTEAHERTS